MMMMMMMMMMIVPNDIQKQQAQLT